MIADRLIEGIVRTQAPICVGLDTAPGYLPRLDSTPLAEQIVRFNSEIVDAVCGLVPAVKVQSAYYEALGRDGAECFLETCRYAKARGMFVIADAKRGDIGATAEQYARAFFEGELGNCIDWLTVNAYLGTDGIAPFSEHAKAADKGIFVLVKTSNPSSGELQNLKLADGRTVYACMGDMAEKWGAGTEGAYGYSRVGAVVGATYPEEAEILRARMPHSFFLIPGYGAQGAGAAMLKHCFKAGGMGGIVNNSRGILCAYQKTDAHSNASDRAALCARDAVIAMKEDLLSVLGAIHA